MAEHLMWKIFQVEHEIQKVSDAYEMLVQHSQKRENLEKVMRFKLDAEVKKLNEANKELKGIKTWSKCFRRLNASIRWVHCEHF